MIKVFGHISPDTDSAGSAILWAWYLNTHTSLEAVPFVLGTLNKETSFVLKTWSVPEPELLEKVEAGEQVVIVDTNNPQELFPNILEANILQVIDHHRLAGELSTKRPIEMTLRPFASTATVIYSLIENHIDTLPKEMAGILISCILSDTLAFRSPTTNPHDRNIVEKLAAKIGLDINSYADLMFAAKSDVSDYTDTGLIHLDSKKTLVGDKNIRISVVETTNPKSILDRKDNIITAIKEILAKESDVDDVLFFVVDILKEESTVFTYNQFTKDIVSASFGVDTKSDTETLPGIVSRKKQILPALQLPKN